MIQLTPQSKILLASEPIDFRKGIDGISLAKDHLKEKKTEPNSNLGRAIKY